MTLGAEWYLPSVPSAPSAPSVPSAPYKCSWLRCAVSGIRNWPEDGLSYLTACAGVDGSLVPARDREKEKETIELFDHGSNVESRIAMNQSVIGVCPIVLGVKVM